jgi:hypothetical protein
MEIKPTAEQIESSHYNDLVKMCKPLGIHYTAQKKEELKSLLLSTINGTPPEPLMVEEPKEKTGWSKKKKVKFVSGKEIEKILKDKTISKSERIRRLYDSGITKTTGLAELVKGHYSFVHGVLSRYRQKKR